jgi:serine/threonine protein kinase/tetratricopeptide (TPR) repeat protein
MDIPSPEHATMDRLSGPPESLVGCLAREMNRRWRQGEHPAAEEFLALHPEVEQEPAAAIDLIYEEICLRENLGHEDIWEDVFTRFPQWRSQLEALRDCHRLLGPPGPTPRYPTAGEALGEFLLRAELGRGARGRVFLATQPALADRPVVLKLTPRLGHEHVSLARLQHSNIVPLYLARDDRSRHLRVLCMPYFGGATLARLLEALSDIPFEKRTGQDLVTALAECQAAAPIPVPGAAATRQVLARASYVQAVCWIGACCADALQYAHERGLVHLDLKPSNVLVAADGQPMLLDFHLAREPVRPDQPAPQELGGTPAYMASEQRAAVQAVGAGTPIPAVVDGRADLYALGALLYEALGGQLPYVPSLSPPLCRLNPQVSVGLADVLARCLAPRADGRYADGAAVAADLRRHLTDQPLCGVANRSLTERWRKWRRRRPGAFRLGVLLLVVLGTTLALVSGTLFYLAERLDEAERLLHEGQQQRQQCHYAEAVRTLQRGLARVEAVPMQRDLVQNLRNQLLLAEQAQADVRRGQMVRELHLLADQVRMLYGMASVSAGRLHSLERRCREVWERRRLVRDYLAAEAEGEWATDLLDLAILWTDLRVRLAPPGGTVSARRQALQVLEEAEALFGPSAVLEHEHRRHRRVLGLAEGSSERARRGNALRPRTAWEHCALGKSFLHSGDLPRALEELQRALVLQPHGLWPNYYYGLCTYHLKRYEEAALGFSVCVGAAPDIAGCYYNRALALAALGRTDQALRDYDRALVIDPTLAAAALNRGILHYQHKRYAQALTDLRTSLEHGADEAAVCYDIALVHLAQKEPTAALESLDRALKHDPLHEQARQLRDRLLESSSRPAAWPSRR